MENLVFTTFQPETQAREGLQKLKELDELGDITIYNIALLRKNGERDFTLLHHEGPDVSDLPVGGMVAGSLVGLLAGPIGMAIGMLTGALAGTAAGDSSEEVTQQFLDKAGKELAPGSYEIVMDVEEDTTFMIDSYMTPFQGKTVHSAIEDEYAENDAARWKALKDEIAEQEKALHVAADKDKAAITAKIDGLKKKAAELKIEAKAKAEKRKKRWNDKIKALDHKIDHFKGKAADKLKAQKEKLRKDFEQYNSDVAFAFD
jgi:uncharacterized membrane protein